MGCLRRSLSVGRDQLGKQFPCVRQGRQTIGRNAGRRRDRTRAACKRGISRRYRLMVARTDLVRYDRGRTRAARGVLGRARLSNLHAMKGSVKDLDRKRCHWAKGALEIRYHDREWGDPVRDDHKLFEMLILEGAQAGLSWSTILAKRDRYREV